MYKYGLLLIGTTCIILGLVLAADIPYVFDQSTSGIADFTQVQLESVRAASPDLAGVPIVSTPTDSEVLEFPVTGGGSVSGSTTEKNVGDLKKTFDSRVEPDNSRVHEEATVLALKYPGDLTIDQIDSIYNYLKNGDGTKKGWGYVRDPRGIDYFSYANASLRLGDKADCVGGGDCDDFAILMSALVESIGGTTRIILAHNNTTGGHAYTEVYIGRLDSPNSQVNEIMEWLKQKYKSDKIFTHVVTDTKDVWLNLDWGPDEKGDAHPGGPFYQGDKHIVICIRDTYQKTPLKMPASYQERARQGSNVQPKNATIPMNVTIPIKATRPSAAPALAIAPAPINETHAESWQKTFGGSDCDEYAHSVQQTSDGGYIIAGTAGSYVAYDTWLIKIDSSGNKIWNKTLGGGDNAANSVQQTSDGGYIIAGWSGRDAWLIKTDSSGNKIWNKTLGEGDNAANSVQQTSDGGYIIAGWTSPYGAGGRDAWLIKTDSSGSKEWDKTFGGSTSDFATSVEQTSDGGYIIAGIAGSYGAYDNWLIKTDSSGNKIWNKSLGGGENVEVVSVRQTSEGGYIIAGWTNSYGAGGDDAWLIKTDSSGNKIWVRTFGGAGNDAARSVQQTSDGGYIIAGDTSSYGAGDRDAWLIKTDSSGNKIWVRTFGGAGDEVAWSVQQTSDGGYIIAGDTSSYGAGDQDAWLIKTDANGN